MRQDTGLPEADEPAGQPHGAPGALRRKLLIWGIVALLTVAGLFLRVDRLRGPEGTLGEDEARLVLAAGGVLTHGIPVMPSGRVYLRGLVNTYLIAASMGVLGRRDIAARLPNALFGALLIPLLFVFGRRIAGTAAGICAAAFATVQPLLIAYSANAWMTSLFVVAFVGALYFLYRGFVLDEPGMQIPGALATVLAVLTHELGVVLAPIVAATLAIRLARGDRRWFLGVRSVVALGILALSVILFVALGLFLRAGTVAGAGGEFRHYIGPSLSPDRFLIAFDRWRVEYLPLLGAAVLGIPLALRSGKLGGLFPYLALAIAGATVWVVIGITTGSKNLRYTLMLLPLLALCAGWAIVEFSALVAGRLRLQPRTAQSLRLGLLALVFGFSLRGNVVEATRRSSPPQRTWVTEFRGLGMSSGDLLMSDNVEAPAWYLGQVHYWERDDNYERYTYRVGSQLRNIYTGSVRVATRADVSELARANAGKTLWYVGDDDGLDEFPPDLREQMLRAARPPHRTQDLLLILRIDLSELHRILLESARVDTAVTPTPTTPGSPPR